jgi:predicted HicB family RNase H-like nuclease
MSISMHYRGYDGSVVQDVEDQLFHGKLLGIRDFVIYDGKDSEELEKNFHGAVDEYLRFCKEDGREPEIPFASFPVHFPPELHKRASLFAEEHDLELNAVVEKALSEYLAHAG